MSWALFMVFGCGLCSLTFAAPQELTFSSDDKDVVESTTTEGLISERPEIVSGITHKIKPMIENPDLRTDEQETERPESEEINIQIDEKDTETTFNSTILLREDISSDSTTTKQEVTVNKGENEAVPEHTVSVTSASVVVTEVTTKKPQALTQTVVPTTKKPLRATTARPVTQDSTTLTPTVSRPTKKPQAPSTQRFPCRCGGGACACCTGLILENFNVPIRSRACANVTYEPDDFAFNFKLLFNNRQLYTTRISGKNPRPACIPINRFFGIKMCARMSNIYMSGRNVHACLELEGFWDDESAFKYSFNCFRIGSNGVAIVAPEDGGGLPPPPDEEQQTDEDYDDSARELVADNLTLDPSTMEDDNNAPLSLNLNPHKFYPKRPTGWTADIETIPN